MANTKNLLKGDARHKFTPEEHSKGGKVSAKVRRERSDLRKLMRVWLETEVTKDKNGDPLTGGEALVAVAAREAFKGNAKFWELIRDTAGFKPVEKVVVADVEQSVIDEVENMVREAGNDTQNAT